MFETSSLETEPMEPVGACAWAPAASSATQPARQMLLDLIATAVGGIRRMRRQRRWRRRYGCGFERGQRATCAAYTQQHRLKLPGTQAGNSPPAAPNGFRDSARASCSFIELNRLTRQRRRRKTLW